MPPPRHLASWALCPRFESHDICLKIEDMHCFCFCLTCAPSSSRCFLGSLAPDSCDIIISLTRKVNQPWKYDLITVSGRKCCIRSERSPLQAPVLQWAFVIIFLLNFSENTLIKLILGWNYHFPEHMYWDMFPEDTYRGIRKFLLCPVLAQKTAGTFSHTSTSRRKENAECCGAPAQCGTFTWFVLWRELLLWGEREKRAGFPCVLLESEISLGSSS